MNNIEKLYDIEQDFARMLKTGTYTIMPSDIRWMIERIKKLTRGLAHLHEQGIIDKAFIDSLDE